MCVVEEEVGEGASDVTGKWGCWETGDEDVAAAGDELVSNDASGSNTSGSSLKGASRRLFCDEEAVIDVSCSV